MTFESDFDPETTALSTYETEHILRTARRLIAEGSDPDRVVKDLFWAGLVLSYEATPGLQASMIDETLNLWRKQIDKYGDPFAPVPENVN